VVAAAARGRSEAVGQSVGRAFDGGCSRAEIREALLVHSLFAGFPRTLDALSAAAGALADRDPHLPAAEPDLPAEDGPRRALFRERGDRLFSRVYGAGAAVVLERLRALDPELPDWVLEDAYGKVLARPVLSAAERERLAVVLLAAQGLRNQLRGHVLGALRCGATRDQVEASLAAAADHLEAEDLALARSHLAG
jgi:4-carboxymuconolactone decarboxylase